MTAVDKDQVTERLRANEAEFRAEGISHVFLFGAVGRGKAPRAFRHSASPLKALFTT